MSSEPENGKNLRDEQPLSAGELSPLISRAQAGDGMPSRRSNLTSNKCIGQPCKLPRTMKTRRMPARTAY